TIKATNFKSYRELYPEREFRVPECQAVGLSVYTDIKDIGSLIRRNPALRKKRGRNKLQLAKGDVTSDWGKIKNTRSIELSHHTWWIPLGKEPWEIFVLVNFPEE
ncbi:MAG: hypothetical protein Q9P01_05995, partial [Anaerolineae bacterium]|nr:hypothetical protein [Anaerolineae bacterium]